jgi:hypothetical protein
MNIEAAVVMVRDCLQAVKPDIDLDNIRDDTPLLETRAITSFDVLDLILHLEQASGNAVGRAQLKPGSFRDVETIARTFVLGETV